MTFEELSNSYLSFINSESSWSDGKSNSKNYTYTIDFSSEISKLQNTSNVKTLSIVSFTLYKEIAIKRLTSEIYKKPSDYVKDYKVYLEEQKLKTERNKNLVNQNAEVINNQKSNLQIQSNITSKVIRKIMGIIDSYTK